MRYSRGIAAMLAVLIVLVLSMLVRAQPNRNSAATDQVSVTTTATLSGTTAVPVAVLRGN